MKLVVLDGHAVNPGDLSWDFLKVFGEVTVYEETAQDQVIPRIQDADIILINKIVIDEALLNACPKLKLVCVLATGYNVVDCDACAKRNIPVFNVPAYGTNAVAQFTFSLLLELCNRVGHHDRLVKDGVWEKCTGFCFWDTPQMELAGKTMGIIGFGAIGRAVGCIAKAFGMQVLAYNRSRCAEACYGQLKSHGQSHVPALEPFCNRSCDRYSCYFAAQSEQHASDVCKCERSLWRKACRNCEGYECRSSDHHSNENGSDKSYSELVKQSSAYNQASPYAQERISA